MLSFFKKPQYSFAERIFFPLVIIRSLCNEVCSYVKDILKAFDDFKNKQKVYEVMFFDM